MKMISNNFSKLYNEGVVIYVQPPARRMAKVQFSRTEFDYYSYSQDDSYNENFFLSFPHIAFRIRYRLGSGRKRKGTYSAVDLKVIFTNSEKLTKRFIPPLPNIDEGMKVCIELPNKGFATLEELSKVVIAKFWATNFNDGMYDAFQEYEENSTLGDHRKWAKKTKKNPKWVPNGRSLVIWNNFDRDDFFGKCYARDEEGDDGY